eukprot:955018_1
MGNQQQPDKPVKPPNISVASMPKKQEKKIAKRLGGLHTKPDLLRELETSYGKLVRMTKQTRIQMDQFQKEIKEIETKTKIDDIKEVTASNILTLELIGFVLKYYEYKLLRLNRKYEITGLQNECFQVKMQRLQNAQIVINRNGRNWDVDKIRDNIEVAFHTAWRVRLPEDVLGKTAELEVIEQCFNDLSGSYTSIMDILKGHTESDEQKKEKLTFILQSVNMRPVHNGNDGEEKEMNAGNEANILPQECGVSEQDTRVEYKQRPSPPQEPSKKDRVVNWLNNELDLSEYVDLFLVNGFDEMNVIIKSMDEQDLIDIGIDKKGHRKKILLYIKEHKHEMVPKMPNLYGNDYAEGHNVVDTAPGIPLWKCPMCDSGNAQSALQCSICGYNIGDNVE